MRSLFDILNEDKKVDKPPPHEKSAIVNEIIRVVGDHPKYNYKYWLKKIGNRSFGDMMVLLKEIEKAPAKYNKGGLLTNKLKKNVQANKIQGLHKDSG